MSSIHSTWSQWRLINPGDADERVAYLALWPTGKMPLLLDRGQPVAETSIIIEHLQRHHAQPGRTLISHVADAAVEVRLRDRLFDLYVMMAMRALTGDLLRPAGQRDLLGVARAREGLLTAFALVDRKLEGKTWATGDHFTMADLRRRAIAVLCRHSCAAAAAACASGGLLRSPDGLATGGADHWSGAALLQVLPRA